MDTGLAKSGQVRQKLLSEPARDPIYKTEVHVRHDHLPVINYEREKRVFVVKT